MTGTGYEPMTVREHLRLLRRRAWVLVAAVVLSVAVAVGWVLLSTPVYEARAELLVASDRGPRAAVLSAASPVLSMLGEPISALGGGNLATQMQIIDSRPSLQDAWGLLQERPEVLERLLTEGLTDGLLEDLPETVAGLSDQPPPSRWPADWRSVAETLAVAPVEESEIIEVRCEAPDPERARDFVNALVLGYLGRSLGDARATTRRTRIYVENQLREVESRLAEAEESLRQFGERVGTVALDESARQQIGLLVRLSEQASIAESNLSARRAETLELEAELAASDERVLASTITRRNPEIVELQSALARAEAERVSLLEEYAPGSMPVRRATAAVDELRERLRMSAAEVVDSRQESINPVAQEIARRLIVAEGERMGAQEAMRMLRRAASRVEGELAGLPHEQVELLKVQREIELLERFYLALKEKQQEYEITERAKSPASRLVVHAIAADEPARPRKALTVAAGLMGGTLLGLLLVGLAEQLDDRLHDEERVANALQVPVIGAFGRRGSGRERGRGADEVLRTIRGHVRALCRGIRGPDVLVLASDGDPGEAMQIAEGLVRVAEADGERVMVLRADGEGGDERFGVDASAVLSATPDGGAALRLLEESGAGLVVAVAPVDGGLLTATALLDAGCPVALVVDLHRTTASAARGLVGLAEEHGCGTVAVIATGADRNSARYLTPGTRARR
jgi:succinoglycan biosynthesis transport protein ExoP